MAISTRTRFEVLKRDGFACHYCGAKSPDVQLHVDHIHPKSRGGGDGTGNLVASCVRCNLSKHTDTLAVVTPCTFCQKQEGGMFFDMPMEGDRHEPARVLICAFCLECMVWAFGVLRKPPTVLCCGCGDEFENHQTFNPMDHVAGGWACVCPPCDVEMRTNLNAAGERLGLEEPVV